jgi:DNA-binding XRE family transcriptional regulator
MEKQRPPILAAYDRAIAKAKELHEARTGKKHGAVTWLASKIGVSRQTIDNWEDRAGFPERYVSKVAKVLGMAPEEVRPRSLNADFAMTTWLAICKYCPESVTNEVIFNPNQRRRKDT